MAKKNVTFADIAAGPQAGGRGERQPDRGG